MSLSVGERVLTRVVCNGLSVPWQLQKTSGLYTSPHICVLSSFSRIQLFASPRTIAHQAPLPMGFSRQEYCSRLPCPPPGDLPDPGIEPMSLMSPALVGRFFTTSTTWEALFSTGFYPQISWTGSWAALCQPCLLVARGRDSLRGLHSPGPFLSRIPLLPVPKVLCCPKDCTSENLVPTHFSTFFEPPSLLPMCPPIQDYIFSSLSLLSICEPKNYPDQDIQYVYAKHILSAE